MSILVGLVKFRILYAPADHTYDTALTPLPSTDKQLCLPVSFTIALAIMPGILPMKVIKVGSNAQTRIAQACDR